MMKRFVREPTTMRIALAVLAMLASISVAAAEPAAHPALAAWADAWARNDVSALARFYAPTASIFTSEARAPAVGPAQVHEALAQDSAEHAARALTFGRHAWRQHGPVAIASGMALARLVRGDGERMPMALRFSMVWIEGAEGWSILDQHLSLLEFDDE
jgi:ketosteroid isomerase-like protein